MNRYLFLLRHAEAERDEVDGDINRPLTPQGIKSISMIGGELHSRGERVQKICSSTAVRAAQTARGVGPYLDYSGKGIIWHPELYLASAGDLLAFLSACPPSIESLMLVGHNPGLQNLLVFLAAAESLPANSSLATATVVKLEIGTAWENLQPECARLIYLIRP
jgi:phosphohistidine phosphatase